MTSVENPFLCAYCAFLHFDSPHWNLRCDAFPNGIPSEILNNDVDHRKEYEGDNGIQYKFADSVFDKEPVSLYRELNKK